MFSWSVTIIRNTTKQNLSSQAWPETVTDYQKKKKDLNSDFSPQKKDKKKAPRLRESEG